MRLRVSLSWEFDVEGTFELSTLEAPLLRGTIRTGVIRPGDWFVSGRDATGRVERIEFVSTTEPPSGQVALGVAGAEIETGDRLRNWIPLA